MDQNTFLDKARKLVYVYACDRLDVQDAHPTFSPDEVYVVTYTYILGNRKALLSTTLPDGMYYEVTYDTSRQMTYFDVYKKTENFSVADEAVPPKPKTTVTVNPRIDSLYSPQSPYYPPMSVQGYRNRQ